MNIRQVASILVSYIMYQHPVNRWQVAGLALVFGALFYKSLHEFRNPKPPNGAKHKPVPTQEDVEMKGKAVSAEVVGAAAGDLVKTGGSTRASSHQSTPRGE